MYAWHSKAKWGFTRWDKYNNTFPINAKAEISNYTLVNIDVYTLNYFNWNSFEQLSKNESFAILKFVLLFSIWAMCCVDLFKFSVIVWDNWQWQSHAVKRQLEWVNFRSLQGVWVCIVYWIIIIFFGSVLAHRSTLPKSQIILFYHSRLTLLLSLFDLAASLRRTDTVKFNVCCCFFFIIIGFIKFDVIAWTSMKTEEYTLRGCFVFHLPKNLAVLYHDVLNLQMLLCNWQQNRPVVWQHHEIRLDQYSLHLLLHE